MPTPERARPSHLHRRVLGWYAAHRRELQWRHTTNPYEVLVSEVMLQQTQVSRVKDKLPAFLRAYPTLRRLAAATNADVIRAWRGMGYNNRAIRLRDMARVVLERHGGRIPADPDALMALPGVGRYTAHAVLTFAFRREVPVVDVNIRRVLSRVLVRQRTLEGSMSEGEAWRRAGELLPVPCYDWNQALMDLGATICTARRPRCADCPLLTCCASAATLAAARPAKRVRSAEPSHDGVPHRIWRGRAVEALRSLDGRRTIALEELGAQLKPGFHPGEHAWLTALIGKLADDGIVTTRRGAGTLRVRLAS